MTSDVNEDSLSDCLSERVDEHADQERSLPTPTQKCGVPERHEIRAMTLEGVYAYLKRKGIPEKYCEVFKDNFIDGEELSLLTAKEIKNMVPPVGLAKKIMRLLGKTSTVTDSTMDDVQPLPAPITASVNLLDSSPAQISASPRTAGSVCSTTSTPKSTATNQSIPAVRILCDEVEVPDHWRPEIEDCIKMKRLTDSCRKEIVRILVSQLFCKSTKPTRAECEGLARKFILKYPFTKDDMGNGYQSWSDKMVERIHNVMKRDRKRAEDQDSTVISAPKRKPKGGSDLLRRYPVSSNSSSSYIGNSTDNEQHEKAIAAELKKKKPQDTVLLPLMKSTYESRRMFILNEVTSVSSIVDKYPALANQVVIIQELELITGRSDIKSSFLSQWTMVFVPAIISYAEHSLKKNVLSCIEKLDRADDTSRQLTAIKVLSQCLCRSKNAICYIYEEYSTSLSIEAAGQILPKRNQPRIGAFVGEESCVQYVIFCEQKVLCKVSTLSAALLIMFGCYYCFNLEYPSVVKFILFFFQDYILQYPDSNKRSASYLGIVSDIKRYV